MEIINCIHSDNLGIYEISCYPYTTKSCVKVIYSNIMKSTFKANDLNTKL